jgi:iron complex transport system substrate-binding protein
MRVVSLLPSSTETVAVLGRASQLVGRSHECDFPPEVVKDVPVLTASRGDGRRGSPGLSNPEPRQVVRNGLSLYQVDEDKLRAIDPDLILTQAQCELCAVTYQVVLEATSRLLGDKTRVLSLQPKVWDEVMGDFLRVAEALGDRPGGARLVDQLSARVEAIEEKVGEAPSPRVLCIEWMDPLIEAGHWMPELIEIAGGSPLFALPGEKSPVVDWDAVLDADPEVILVAPCGFRIEQTCADIDALRGRPGWRSLQAVREERVFLLDGNAYVNRPGPRLVDTLEIVAALVHPDLFPPPAADTHLRLSGKRV